MQVHSPTLGVFPKLLPMTKGSRRNKREEQEAFVQFRAHYLFDAQYCAQLRDMKSGKSKKLAQNSLSQFLFHAPNVTNI
jgi:hypothetical protein